MAIAITTKFFGPTDTKGARVKATDENTGRTLTLPWEHACSHDENHEYAANKLADSQYSVPRILGRSWMRNQSRVHLYEPTP